jgi:hypothetical protein
VPALHAAPTRLHRRANLHRRAATAPPPRRYEGLTREAIAHGMGVMTFGNGTGGGFHLREVSRGDK